MCQNPNYYKIISYLCSAKSSNHNSWPIKHDFEDALIVQRIERGFPKPKIWVRFPVGVQYISANKQIFSLLADFYFNKSPYISPYMNRIKSLTPSRLHTLTFFNYTNRAIICNGKDNHPTP